MKLKFKIKIKYNRENGLANDDDNNKEEFTQLNSQAKKQKKTKSQKISKYVERKWKTFKADWITAIKTLMK